MTTTASRAPVGGTPSTSPPGPALRRLPVPRSEPPYDDEGKPSPASLPPTSTQGTLALSFLLPSGLPAIPAPPLHLVAGSAGGDDADGDFAPRSTPRDALPAPRPWVARLAQAVVEVLGGSRPLAQLIRWTSEDVYTALRTQVALLGSQPADTRGRRLRPLVTSVHVSEPVDGVAEACVLVRDGRRSRAMALRLEGLDGRWQCTALQVG